MEMSAEDFARTLLVWFAALFPLVNPLGGAPIFFSLTRSYPPAAQRVLVRKIAAYELPNYFASAADFMPSSSFLMSSGDNCGRSTLIVSLLSLAVSGNGGW